MSNETPVPVSAPLHVVREARALLRRYFPPSPLVRSATLSETAGCQVFLKVECALPTRSFKPRGALWALSVNVERRAIREVTAASTGNHGAAVAYAAKALGIRATVFLPRHPNPVKRDRIARLGARIVEVGDEDLAVATAAAAAHASANGAYFLNDATDPDLPAGPGTIALEIMERLASADLIIVPMGDTALIRGLAAAARQMSPAVRIVGVQAAGAPSYVLSWRQHRVVETETCDTIADGLSTRLPDGANVRAICELVDDVVLVTDRQILSAMRHLAVEDRVVAEPAGAAATAALLHAAPRVGENTVLLVTGANVPCHLLRTAIRTTVPI